MIFSTREGHLPGWPSNCTRDIDGRRMKEGEERREEGKRRNRACNACKSDYENFPSKNVYFYGHYSYPQTYHTEHIQKKFIFKLLCTFSSYNEWDAIFLCKSRNLPTRFLTDSRFYKPLVISINYLTIKTSADVKKVKTKCKHLHDIDLFLIFFFF